MMRSDNKPLRPAGGAGARRGFTIIELLVVIAIILVLVGLLISGSGDWRGKGVTVGGNLVLENLALARELSIAKSQPVELWFLQKTSGTLINAIQIRLVTSNGDTTGYDRVQRLPVNTGLDTGNSSNAANTLSSLIVTSNAKQWNGSISQPSISDFGTSYNCWYVRFMPDGSTSLASSAQWYVTLHEAALGNGLSKLPPNYAVLSISPITGKATVYRP